ncbi:DNA adenine methylase [Chitinophaga oryzae]|uniref:site-specific DNA-methyltransferase (cytosine-N(4)-specific) n=1 Tax=Chitinophaga oryzae TaxID=2725414 RepID=A0AAE6ZC67_9BACT|nr:DNA methyltransferase [Chitinophaga oryzae]QJB29854.1 DNA adenine methylase [Chitinophaga oryzae]
MQSELELNLETRTDYTFKYNKNLGRHGWLRLTPAYSVKLVKEIIKKDCANGSHILDPFAGTSTTGLVSAELGYDSSLFDINPFLVWLGNTKCKNFSEDDLSNLLEEVNEAIENVALEEPSWVPPIYNIQRWWHDETLQVLSSMRAQLSIRFLEPGNNYCHNLVWIAFSRLIIETSSAAFNHTSMSFKEDLISYEFNHIKNLFKEILNHIISSCRTNLSGTAEVHLKDSRDLSALELSVDTVITSPPYPNRMSYIRELRPYMYWAKFLNNANDASVLDWSAIGGTWGTATSNLKTWKPLNDNLPPVLYTACEMIKNSEDKNASLMSLYVHKYFDDMYEHIKNLKPILKSGAKLNYIIGNSSFYGIFVHSDLILSQIFTSLGYENVSVDIIRKRNTKKGLLEFNVRACYA